jgi:hypothetical protein
MIDINMAKRRRKCADRWGEHMEGIMQAINEISQTASDFSDILYRGKCMFTLLNY